MASGVRPGDTVVTVPHTFIATTEAISQAGAETDFVDIDERTYTLTPQAGARISTACREIRDGTPNQSVERAAVTGDCPRSSVRADGRHGSDPRDREPLRTAVIEDACQAHGAEYFSPDGTLAYGGLDRAMRPRSASIRGRISVRVAKRAR